MIKKLIFLSIIAAPLNSSYMQAQDAAMSQSEQTSHTVTAENSSDQPTEAPPALQPESKPVTGPSLYERLIQCLLLASVDFIFKIYETGER